MGRSRNQRPDNLLSVSNLGQFDSRLYALDRDSGLPLWLFNCLALLSQLTGFVSEPYLCSLLIDYLVWLQDSIMKLDRTELSDKPLWSKEGFLLPWACTCYPWAGQQVWGQENAWPEGIFQYNFPSLPSTGRFLAAEEKQDLKCTESGARLWKIHRNLTLRRWRTLNGGVTRLNEKPKNLPHIPIMSCKAK